MSASAGASRENGHRRLVLSISRMTVHNGPGIRTLILFKGCPLRCVWCSTPESQSSEPEVSFRLDRCIRCGCCAAVCPEGAIDITRDTARIDRALCTVCGKCAEVCSAEAITILGKWMTVQELVREVAKDKVFHKHSGGGVTISGGEALLDPEFTLELVRALVEDGVSVGVDTSGQVPWASIEQLLPYVDFFLWDIKHMDPERHKELTGASNELILRNLRAVSERGTPIYLRIPIMPGLNDSPENIAATCEFARGLSSLVEVDLLPLHHLGKARYDSLDRPYPIADLRLVPDPVIQELKALVESYGLEACVVG